MAYPNAFTAAIDGVTTVAAALINQLETKVGVNNSTDPTSLEYKVNHFLAGFIGVILPFGGASAPAGFLLCDGSAINRTTYAALFAIIGVVFGVGNGSTTFNVPDLRQRFPLGKAVSGTGAVLGAVGGTIDHTHDIMILDQGDISAFACSHGDPDNPTFQIVNYIIKY